MGITQKMEGDVKTSPIVRGMFEEAFWTPTNEIGTDVLTLGHLLPFFVVLAFGLSLSVIIIVLELILGQSKKNIIAQATLQSSNINSDKSSGECKEEYEIEIWDKIILEPTKGISPELKNNAKKGPNTAKEKESNNIITVLVEIQEGLKEEESTRESFQVEAFNVSATSLNSLDIMDMDRIGPCEAALMKDNKNIRGNNNKQDENFSGEWSPLRNSSHWSEIITFLDNEGSTTESEKNSTKPTPVITPGHDMSNNIDSRSLSSCGSAGSEENITESVMAMVEIHETPKREMSGSSDK